MRLSDRIRLDNAHTLGFWILLLIRHIHLHVISSDLDSPSLKSKKHFNSFHPELGFFIPLDQVIRSIKDHSWNQVSPTSTLVYLATSEADDL